MEPTAKVLQFIAESGMSDAQFTRETGISNGLIGQWRSGIQKASLKNLQKIADHFKLDVSTFLSNNEPIKISTTPTKKELIDAINSMSDEQAELFLKLIKQVKEGSN